MIYSHRWAQGGSLARALLQALVLTALVSVLLLFASSRIAFAQSVPKADYRFQNTRSTSIGSAPTLKDIGPKSNTFTTTTVDGTSRRVLSFPKGNGLKLSPTTRVVSSNTYTIVVLFQLDRVDGFRRIIDFKNGTSDNGLYVQDGKLRFYPHAQVGGAQIAQNQYVQVVLTRNSGGTVTGYVNGGPQISFSDASNDAVIDSNKTLRFFRDNQSGGATTEHSAGSVARIRFYEGALGAPEVAALDRLDYIVPPPWTPRTSTSGMAGALRTPRTSVL